jgi:hypothetical protein
MRFVEVAHTLGQLIERPSSTLALQSNADLRLHNPLWTKSVCRCVRRSEHSYPWLYKTNLLRLCKAKVAVFCEIVQTT